MRCISVLICLHRKPGQLIETKETKSTIDHIRSLLLIEEQRQVKHRVTSRR